MEYPLHHINKLCNCCRLDDAVEISLNWSVDSTLSLSVVVYCSNWTVKKVKVKVKMKVKKGEGQKTLDEPPRPVAIHPSKAVSAKLDSLTLYRRGVSTE